MIATMIASAICAPLLRSGSTGSRAGGRAAVCGLGGRQRVGEVGILLIGQAAAGVKHVHFALQAASPAQFNQQFTNVISAHSIILQLIFYQLRT